MDGRIIQLQSVWRLVLAAFLPVAKCPHPRVLGDGSAGFFDGMLIPYAVSAELTTESSVQEKIARIDP